MVAAGLSNKQIGARLFISERTVDSHVRNILNKLGFNSRAQVASWMGSEQQAGLTHRTYVRLYSGSAVVGDALCPRCLEFEDEIRELHQRLAAVGQYVTYSPGPSPTPNLERELQRWLAVNPRADAAAGFRAGWSRLARFVRPLLRDWEARWWRAVRENDRVRAQIGTLLREISRLTERG